ncbi:MAG: hypothetical protein A2629_01940 [Candidatus Levybacteria bacterium RIFCSPHIGHO2_01_FULL_41_15]|nr:MAG: hypothetical protein A2629_01940 [Candidatus Levybacteria bacterium RIFCSPHIGHO2_01_FULL_41_15]
MEIESAVSTPSNQQENFLDQILNVEKNSWPPELQASREKFKSRLRIFPQGFLTVKINEKIKGVSTSQITTYDPSSQKTWDEITGNGMIKKTHNPSGNALYVVSVGVSADSQGKGIGGMLIQSQIELAEKLGLKYLFLGARIPGYDAYCKHNGDITVEDYLKKKNEKGDIYDPEIRFYDRQGLHVVKIIPDFEPDEQSRNYGIVMLWENHS